MSSKILTISLCCTSLRARNDSIFRAISSAGRSKGRADGRFGRFCPGFAAKAEATGPDGEGPVAAPETEIGRIGVTPEEEEIGASGGDGCDDAIRALEPTVFFLRVVSFLVSVVFLTVPFRADFALPEFSSGTGLSRYDAEQWYTEVVFSSCWSTGIN